MNKKIFIIFPKEYFTQEQLQKLNQYDLKFVEGKDIDLNNIKDLYSGEEFILAINPVHVKGYWECLPLDQIKKMKGLKGLCLATTSSSWLDIKQINQLGITLTNCPGKSTNAVAEFNIFLMLALLKKIPLIIKNKWQMDYDKFLNKEAKGLTAGILGLGQIGTRLAQLCQGLAMKVCYWNRTKRKTSFQAVSLPTLFKNSDVVFTTISTGPHLKGFIPQKLLAQLKKTALLIDTAMSIHLPDTQLHDVPFILNQVAKGNLGGFAFEDNKKTVQDYQGNVMICPEQAFYTLETQQNTARILTDSILSVIKGKPINQVK